MTDQVITRFAPSPTGYLHLGGARTALYNWLFARQNKGKFILRIEDTDAARSTEQSTQAIFEAMEWLGLSWDEEPYYQSQRLDLYRQELNRLVEEGWIYPAFESKDELEAMRQKAISEKRNPIYDRSSLQLSQHEIAQRINRGDTFVWRFKVPDEGYTEVPELLMGGAETKLKNSDIGDFIVSRPGTKEDAGMPLYNFVCTIDDAHMQISHVIRGTEHLTNASRQILLYKALGYKLPQFVHLPIITKNNKKMSKRDVDADGLFPVSVMERARLGYLPEATLNHLVLLGWSHPQGQELLELEEILQEFSLERLNKSSANFDEKKYFHFNSYHLAKQEDAEVVTLVRPYLEAAGLALEGFNQEQLEKMVAMEKTRCQILSEFPEALAFFFTPPGTYEEKGVNKFFLREDLDISNMLFELMHDLESCSFRDQETIERVIHQCVERQETELKYVGPAVRLALTGRMRSPGLAEMMDVLGKAEVLSRLQAAREYIALQKNAALS